jgi:hypothetical protein
MDDSPDKGVNLRDYFAAAALQGYLAHRNPHAIGSLDRKSHCQIAYEYADLMLAARELKPAKENL